MNFGYVARFFEGSGGVFVGLARLLMGGEAALAVGRGSGHVGMCGKIVELGDSFVTALRHACDLSGVRCQPGATR